MLKFSLVKRQQGGMLRQIRSYSVNLRPAKKAQLTVNQSRDKTNEESKQLDSRFVRKFPLGTVYDPFDFSLARLHLDKKFESKSIAENEAFETRGVNPLDLYTSPEKLSKYMTSTGKILHRDVTGLSAKNQRRISKAIRRCQAFGLLSKTHRDISMLPKLIPDRH